MAIRFHRSQPAILAVTSHSLPHDAAFIPNSMPAENLIRIFISYSDREPDLSLARELHARLKSAGHHSFMAAESMELGDKWSEKIDLELRQCDYFLLLLSPQSARRSYVAEELQRAKTLQDNRADKRPQILPIRVGSFQDADINFKVAGNVSWFHHIEWGSHSDVERIAAAILKVIGKQEEPTTQSVSSSSHAVRPGSATRIGLTVPLHKQCTLVLRQCPELSDRHTVEVLFGLYPLTRYVNAIPLEAKSQVQLLEMLIHNLITYPATNGKPLLELVSTLRDKRDPTEADWTELNELSQRLDLHFQRLA